MLKYVFSSTTLAVLSVTLATVGPAAVKPVRAQCYSMAAGGAGHRTGQPLNPRAFPDNLLLTELGLLQRTGTVNIGNVVWVDEVNAYAQKGFGIKLGRPLWETFVRARGTVAATNAFMYVVYHEYSHLFQFANYSEQEMRRLPSELVELQADLLAGVAYGQRIGESNFQAFADGGTTAFEIGDTNFSSPDHHGTLRQRMAALITGIEAGRAIRMGRVPMGWAEGNYGAATPQAYIRWSLNEVRKITARLDPRSAPRASAEPRGPVDDARATEKAGRPPRPRILADAGDRGTVLRQFVSEARNGFTDIKGRRLRSEDGETAYASTLRFPGAQSTEILSGIGTTLEATVFVGEDESRAEDIFDSLANLADECFPNYRKLDSRTSRVTLKRHHIKGRGEPGVSVSLLKLGGEYQVLLRVHALND